MPVQSTTTNYLQMYSLAPLAGVQFASENVGVGLRNGGW